MKIKPKILTYFMIILTLAVSMACGLTSGGGKSSPQRPTASPDTGSQEPGKSAENIVNITESEFRVTIEPQPIQAGAVTFVVQNEGHAPHDIHIWGNGVDHQTSLLDGGESETFTIPLEKGTYNYECTVEGHSKLGMQGTLTVE